MKVMVERETLETIMESQRRKIPVPTVCLARIQQALTAQAEPIPRDVYTCGACDWAGFKPVVVGDTYCCPVCFKEDDEAESVCAHQLCDERPQAEPASVPYDKHEREITQVMIERDRYHDEADKLANAIAEYFDVDIGEHSSANCPWERALEEIEYRSRQKAEPDWQKTQRVKDEQQTRMATVRYGEPAEASQPHDDECPSVESWSMTCACPAGKPAEAGDVDSETNHAVALARFGISMFCQTWANKMRELMDVIEKIPPSPEQTAASVLCDEMGRELLAKRDELQPEATTSQTTVLEGFDSLVHSEINDLALLVAEESAQCDCANDDGFCGHCHVVNQAQQDAFQIITQAAALATTPQAQAVAGSVECPKCKHEYPMPMQSIRTILLRAGMVSPEWVHDAAEDIAQHWLAVSTAGSPGAMIENILAGHIEKARNTKLTSDERIAALEIDNERLRQIETDEALRLLSRDEARLVLFQAIEAIKIGNKWDDKLILEELQRAGYGIARLEKDGRVDRYALAQQKEGVK